MFPQHTQLSLPIGGVFLEADLVVPDAPSGLVVLLHTGAGERRAHRTQAIARWLEGERLATLAIDLLTEAETRSRTSALLREDVGLLGGRAALLIDWVRAHGVLGRLRIGVLGAGDDAAAALVAAAARPRAVAAVVSCGGTPDAAGAWLTAVGAPTLLLTCGLDGGTLARARRAQRWMRAQVEIDVVHDADPAFEVPGSLEQAAIRAGEWFLEHLPVAHARVA